MPGATVLSNRSGFKRHVTIPEDEPPPLQEWVGGRRLAALFLCPTCEKIADVGYRLGAAMGMTYQRVRRSDPMWIEIEMQPVEAAGWTPTPAVVRSTGTSGS